MPTNPDTVQAVYSPATPSAPLAVAATGAPAAPSSPLASGPTANATIIGIAATLTAGNIRWTAQAAGAAGNSISITIAAAVTFMKPAVTVSSNAITVLPGTKQNMIIGGSSTPLLHSLLVFVGILNGYPEYSSDGISSAVDFALHPGPYSALFWAGTGWGLYKFAVSNNYTDAGNFGAKVTSAAGYPDGLSYSVLNGSGTPTVTAATTTGAQAIAAANAAALSSALVKASAVGDVSGTVSTLALTNLAGGGGLENPAAANAVFAANSPSVPLAPTATYTPSTPAAPSAVHA